MPVWVADIIAAAVLRIDLLSLRLRESGRHKAAAMARRSAMRLLSVWARVSGSDGAA